MATLCGCCLCSCVLIYWYALSAPSFAYRVLSPPSFTDRVLSALPFAYRVLSAPSCTYRLLSPLPVPIVCCLGHPSHLHSGVCEEPADSARGSANALLPLRRQARGVGDICGRIRRLGTAAHCGVLLIFTESLP